MGPLSASCAAPRVQGDLHLLPLGLTDRAGDAGLLREGRAQSYQARALR